MSEEEELEGESITFVDEKERLKKMIDENNELWSNFINKVCIEPLSSIEIPESRINRDKGLLITITDDNDNILYSITFDEIKKLKDKEGL